MRRGRYDLAPQPGVCRAEWEFGEWPGRGVVVWIK